MSWSPLLNRSARVLKRKCACGGTPGLGGECESCRKTYLLSQQRTEPNAAILVGSRTTFTPRKATAHVAAPRDSHFGFDFSRVKIYPDPGKALAGEFDEMDEEKPDPHAGGSATIKCDGKGGYELLLNGWATAKCGTKDCVIAHESSHMADWKAKWPTGCKDQPKGYLPKGDPPDDPLMTAAEYNAFLKASECKAHTADLNCANGLEPTEACKDTVKNYIKLTETQKKKWCPDAA